VEFSRNQRFVMGEVVGWLVITGVLLVIAQNYQDIRRVVAEAIVGHKLDLPQRDASEQTAPAEPVRVSEGVELVADGSGHYAATIEINGRPVESLVDTGATIVVLSYEAAERAGIYLRPQDFTLSTETANGRAKVAPVTLDRVALGPILVRNVQAAVAEPGRLKTNLLGMSFLKRLQKFEIRSGRLILQD
jgi:aspartyl protease family protein